MTRTHRRPHHRLLATIAAAAVVLAGTTTPPSPARAESSQAGTGSPGAAACPSTIPDDEFDDVPVRHVHEADIDCLTWWGIGRGYAGGHYRPEVAVTRGQIAAFLRRTFAVAQLPLPPASTVDLADALADVAPTHPHLEPIRQLLEAGVIRSRPDGRFAPNAALRRDDMAVFLVNGYTAASGGDGAQVAGDEARFDDLDGHPDAEQIRQAAALGFTNGVSATRYAPSRTVTRSQMAAFLARLLTRLVDEGTASAPTRPGWDGVPPGRTAHLPLPAAPAGSYTLMHRVADGTGVRWDPCEVIDVRVNVEGAPPYARRAVRRAVRKVEQATGTTMEIRTTDLRQRRPHERITPEGVLLVNWPETWDTPGPAGWGGITWSGSQVRNGIVSIDPAFDAGIDRLVELLMHELGHAMGLLHTQDDDQIMFPVMSRSGRLRWGIGDRAGLARVGRGAGCFAPTLQPFSAEVQVRHLP